MAEVTKAKRSRKYWLGCNWKCNGSIDFIKDSVANLFNDVQFNSEHLGKLPNQAKPELNVFVNDYRLYDLTWYASLASCAGNSEGLDSGWSLKLLPNG